MASTSTWKVPNILLFEVKCQKAHARTKALFFEVDLSKFELYRFAKKGGDKKKTFQFSDIEKLEKSIEHVKQLTVSWKPRPDTKKTKSEAVMFKSPEERERFWEAAWWCIRKGAAKATDEEEISVFIGTWNLGNAPPPASFEPWIPKNRHDIYFIGLQESNYEKPKEFKSLEAHLYGAFEAHLGPDYVLVTSGNLWEIRLLLFVRRVHEHKISNVEISKEATGIAHVVGNKGGIGTSFKFNESSFCFVSSHLAAHQGHADDRNANFKEIVEGIKVGDIRFDITSQFHYAFWCGDLNYRIDLPREDVMTLIQSRSWDKLLVADQLLRERDQLGHVFPGWKEGRIDFPPTYRYERGNRQYAVDKMRIPSWCDRVMWKTLPELEVQQTAYDCCNALTTSDHSPVFSTFRVRTKLPNVPHRPEQCRIFITDLRGEALKSMDTNGFSDPYVLFTAPFLHEEKRTVIIERTLNPVYHNEDVPVLTPFATNREYLRLQHLFLILRDYDHATKDDEMGQTVIALRNACSDEPMPFSVPVIDQGKPYGVLHGRLHVVFGSCSNKTSQLDSLRTALTSLDDTAVRNLLQSLTRADPRAALLAMAAGSPAYVTALAKELPPPKLPAIVSSTAPNSPVSPNTHQGSQSPKQKK